MSSFSWTGPVAKAHGGNSLKSYFETIFSTPAATPTMVALVQHIMDTAASSIITEYPLRVSTVRWMLQSCPKPIVSRVTINTEIIPWICMVSNSTEASIALRGLSLTVLSLIIRCFPRITDDMLQPVTQSIASNIQVANALMSEKKTTNMISPTDILLHQCVDIMNSAGEDSLWIRPLHTSLGTAAMLIQQCYQDHQCAPAQRVVDANKVFGTVAATWLIQYAQDPSTLPCSSNNSFEHSALIVAPAVIVKILLSCDVVHDSFAYAFQLALDVVLEMEKHGMVSVDDHQLHHVFDDCLTAIEDADLGDVVMLKRVEALVGFIGSFYENSQSEQCRIVKNTKEIAVMSCILSLQQRMVTAIQEIKQYRLNGSVEEAGVLPEQRRFVGTDKELRTCCADVRRACIAVAGAVLRACPSWVTDEPERFWTLTTGPRSLATPLLMGVGYRAILARTKLNDVVSGEKKEEISKSEKLRMRMVMHVANALRDVSKYSLAAADDIITAVRDLCEASQRGPYLLWWQKADVLDQDAEEDIPLLLLRAYALRPKIPPSVSSQNGKPSSAASSSLDDAQVVQWKASVLSALRDTLTLGHHGRKFATCYDDLCLSNTFSMAFARELTSDILLLHRCINASSLSSVSGGAGGGVPKGLSATGEGLKENRRLSRERFGSAQGDVLAELLLTVTAVLIVFVEAFDKKHVRNSSSVNDTNNSCFQSVTADRNMDKNKGWDKDFDKEVVRLLQSTPATTITTIPPPPPTTTTMPNSLSEAAGHINELNDVATADGTTEHEVLPAHVLICLLQLSRHLQGTLGRPAIFEDELAQTCAEADLVAKITVTLLHVQVPLSESLNSNDKDEERDNMVERWRLFVLQCIREAIHSFCGVCYGSSGSTEETKDTRTNVDVLRYRACRDALLFVADNVAEILKTMKKKDAMDQLTTLFTELNALLPIDPMKIVTTTAAEQNITQIGTLIEKLFML